MGHVVGPRRSRGLSQSSTDVPLSACSARDDALPRRRPRRTSERGCAARNGEDVSSPPPWPSGPRATTLVEARSPLELGDDLDPSNDVRVEFVQTVRRDPVLGVVLTSSMLDGELA